MHVNHLCCIIAPVGAAYVCLPFFPAAMCGQNYKLMPLRLCPPYLHPCSVCPDHIYIYIYNAILQYPAVLYIYVQYIAVQ